MRLKTMKATRARPQALAAGGVLAATGLILATQLAVPASASQDAGPQTVDAARCTGLAGKTLGGALIQSGEPIASGVTLLKSPFGELKAPAAFCRVKATTSSGPGSLIKLEVYLPANWNGKLVGVGGGGLSGGLASAPLTLSLVLKKGYAGLATNAGHDDEPNAAWAIKAPAKIADFGHNANHLGLVAAKATLVAYYGQPAQRAYFHGCSNGGRDALILAQRYPKDYDGIVAGAPAADYTGVMAAFTRNGLLFKNTPGAQTLQSKLPLLRDAVIAKCDRLDGVADGVLEDPRACRFDPAELQCKSGQDTAKCLTEPEVGFARALYQGTRGRNGQLIYSGLPVSSEASGNTPGTGWASWFMGDAAGGTSLARDFYRGLIKQDVKWEATSFNLDRDYAESKAKVGADIDALNTDLTPFIKGGGKLLIYQGWEDPAIPAGATLKYYDAMRKRTGAKADESVRLFMAPGMQHCFAGPGPYALDQIGDIDRWVSSGNAPKQIMASRPESVLASFLGQDAKILRTRPLCAYPMTAHYNGTGSTDEAANFSCKAPKASRG